MASADAVAEGGLTWDNYTSAPTLREPAMPQLQQQLSEEPRYDAETLRKVTALAHRLQHERQETLTAREMEVIGAEVGLESPFIRQALERVTAQHPVARTESAPNVTMRKAIAAAWWAAAWTIPFLLLFLCGSMFGEKAGALCGFFSGWGIYLAGGIILNGLVGEGNAQPATTMEDAPHSRAELLNALTTLPGMSAGSKNQRQTILGVAVAGHEALTAEPAAEHAFAQLWGWVDEIARAYGGELVSSASEGVAFVFTEDAAALRAARALQTGIPRFNMERNRLSQPFRLRCGLSAGEQAVSGVAPQAALLDRAALHQKHAEPGDIVLGVELAAPGLVELGGLAPIAGVGGEPAFSWQAAQRRMNR